MLLIDHFSNKKPESQVEKMSISNSDASRNAVYLSKPEDSKTYDSKYQEDDLSLSTFGEANENNESPDSANNSFLNSVFKEKYLAIYENAKYECRFRFDENFKWTKSRQRKLTYKLDFYVTLLACLLFTALQMDRSN